GPVAHDATPPDSLPSASQPVPNEGFSPRTREREAIHAGEAVQVLAAPGVLAEVREVLREVKTLLLSGVAADEIGLVFRSLEPYRHALTEVARETGVPLAVAGGEALGARPSVQVVLDLLQVPLGDYRQPDVVKLLKSNFIDTGTLRQGLTVSGEDLEWVACEARLIGGRAQWVRQLDLYLRRLVNEHRLAEQGYSSNADGDDVRSLRRIEEEQRVLGECRELFERLVQRLTPLEREQTRTEHVRGLHGVLRELGVAERLAHGDACHQMAANVIAFRRLLEALAALAEADGLLDRPEAIPFTDFATEVVTLCSDTQYDQPLRPEGRVVALDVYGARQVRKPYLFLCGLVEGNWPRVRGEKTFFDDRERYRLNQIGIALDLSADLQRQEAFLFGLACAAAEERLYLSYPTVDSEGQPLVRSHYVDEALEVFTNGSVTLRQRRLSEVLIEPEEAACRRELLETALARESLQAWELYAAGAPAATSRWADHARKCAQVEQQRASREPFEGHDGLLSDPLIKERLAARYGLDYAWSATALGGYGTCPFSFFVQRVLRLETIEPPTEEVENLDYGNIIHRILQAFFSLWQTHHPSEALSESQLAGACREMSRIVDETFTRWENEGLVTHRALWRLAREQARRDLLALVAYEVSEVGQYGYVPRAFEARYEAILPAGAEGEPLRIRGKIDRVDVRPVVPPGQPQQFAVYDYKGNDGVSPQLIEAGCDFQMPFYVTAAIQQVLGGQEPPAQCAQWAYYRYRQPVKLCRKVGVEATRWSLPLDEYLQKANEMAHQHVQNVREGQFMVNPHHCPSYCDFKDVCRYTPARVEGKGCGEDAQDAQEVQP
ncbi:MAG: PD-(D/E)XK nuclease family protein, partial [Armatimonadota bacterium]